MKISWKPALLICAFVAGLLLSFSLAFYLKGRRVGVATTKMVDVTKELNRLDEEKHAIHNEIRALDHDALRTRILELSSRVHEEAARAHPK